jgi:hypothetical protein
MPFSNVPAIFGWALAFRETQEFRQEYPEFIDEDRDIWLARRTQVYVRTSKSRQAEPSEGS